MTQLQLIGINCSFDFKSRNISPLLIFLNKGFFVAGTKKKSFSYERQLPKRVIVSLGKDLQVETSS